MTPQLRELLGQALGAKPANETNWEQLHSPETDLLPTVVARMTSGQQSAKAKGLVKYTWIRYQLARKEALKVSALASDELLLADDLRLASFCYGHPSERVLHGIDFVTRRSTLTRLEPQLARLGWKKPDWDDGPGYSEWRGPEAMRLRFHFQWLRHHRAPLDDVFQRAEEADGFRLLGRVDQICRTCWQGVEHLWLVDATVMLWRDPSLKCRIPEEFLCLAGRWNLLSQQIVGSSLELETTAPKSRTLAQTVLGLLHRRGDIFSRVLEELSMQLVSEGNAGWPQHWARVLCERWAVTSAWQLPRAFYRRLRRDFS